MHMWPAFDDFGTLSPYSLLAFETVNSRPTPYSMSFCRYRNFLNSVVCVYESA